MTGIKKYFPEFCQILPEVENRGQGNILRTEGKRFSMTIDDASCYLFFILQRKICAFYSSFEESKQAT